VLKVIAFDAGVVLAPLGAVRILPSFGRDAKQERLFDRLEPVHTEFELPPPLTFGTERYIPITGFAALADTLTAEHKLEPILAATLKYAHFTALL
jgi:hypothetical protein